MTPMLVRSLAGSVGVFLPQSRDRVRTSFETDSSGGCYSNEIAWFALLAFNSDEPWSMAVDEAGTSYLTVPSTYEQNRPVAWWLPDGTVRCGHGQKAKRPSGREARRPGRQGGPGGPAAEARRQPGSPLCWFCVTPRPCLVMLPLARGRLLQGGPGWLARPPKAGPLLRKSGRRRVGCVELFICT